MKPKPPLWSIEDLIDLEYFLYQDEQLPDGKEKTEQHKRERSFYLDSIPPHGEKQSEMGLDSNRSLIRLWLEFRRNAEKSSTPHEAVLPGDIFKQTYAFTVLMFMLLGFGSGSGLSFSFLIYKGNAPLNVSSYLGLFVLTQVALIFLVISYLVFNRFKGMSHQFSLIRWAVTTLLIKLSLWVRKRSERHLSAEKRSHFQSTLGVIRGKSRNYTALFPWPVFILTQVFGVFFNLGVLTATLLRVIGSDLAFGWQSTLQLSGAAVHKATVILSLPWSWLVPHHLAHPSLSQIEGSRIILKDGITRLATPDLTAWWPFLCFAVLVYGLFPRLFFLISASILKKRALSRIRFQSIAFDKLILRLRSPSLDTRGESQEPHRQTAHNDEPSNAANMTSMDRPVIILIPEDIFDSCTDRDLNDHLGAIFRSPLHRKVAVSLDMDCDRSLIDSLLKESGCQMVLLMESWQPPIRETMQYIQDIRKRGGLDFRLHILLTGTPTSQTIFTKPADHDLKVWKHGINAMGDPNINLESLS